MNGPYCVADAADRRNRFAIPFGERFTYAIY